MYLAVMHHGKPACEVYPRELNKVIKAEIKDQGGTKLFLRPETDLFLFLHPKLDWAVV